MYAVVGLHRVSGSSQSVCLNVGHQESKLHVNFMLGEDFFFNSHFLLALLWILQPLYSNAHDMAADNVSDTDYSWHFKAKHCNPLFMITKKKKKKRTFFLSKLFHRSELEHSSLLSKTDPARECVINLVARESSVLNQLKDRQVSQRTNTKHCCW